MATGAQQLEEESIQTVAPEAPITYLRNVNNAQNGAIAHPSEFCLPICNCTQSSKCILAQFGVCI